MTPSAAPVASTSTAVDAAVQLSALQPYAVQEKALASHAKWKKYAQTVDKTLQSFESVKEWADFITFLAKLLKTLQAYPHFPIIPHKLTVAKRLSQCLNPALPTGVHQRALDVYVHILTVIGPENLKRDMPAWSTGLFPFFQYAATSVKPIVLSIYERFYLPLQGALRPAMKSFILALLPGLEEETGEFFEKVAALLDRLSGTVSPPFFFQNLWLVLMTAPGSRIPAINYLAKRLPKTDADDSLTNIVGADVSLMVRGFAAALNDAQLLVQRGILDLLVTTLKMHSHGFKSTSRDDQVLLMRAVIGVVLRRDLSLSRRLYAWLLGSSEAPDAQVEYLKQNGLDLLREALKLEMDLPPASSNDQVDRQRPYKIFISLLDKYEIGAPLAEVLVLDAFSALKATTSNAEEGDNYDLLMTGNMLFEIIDPFLIWKQLYCSLKEAVEAKEAKAVDLARFMVGSFRLNDEEVQKLHAPFIAFSVLDLVEQSIEETAEFSESAKPAIDFVRELLDKISPKFYETTETTTHFGPNEKRVGESLASALYGAADIKTASLPEFEGRELLVSGLETSLRLAAAVAKELASANEGSSSVSSLLLSALEVIAALAAATAYPASDLELEWKPEEWTEALITCLDASPASPFYFGLHSAIVNAILTLVRTPTIVPAVEGSVELLESLLSKLLDYLQPHCAPCLVEAVNLIWAVEAISGNGQLESMISKRLEAGDRSIRLAAFEAFGNLWRFTEDSKLPGVVLKQPMFMVLDSLKSEDLSTRRAGEAWMRCSLKSYLRILDPLLFALLDPAVHYETLPINVGNITIPVLAYTRPFDQARIQHVLNDLLSLTRFGGQGLIRIAKGSFLKHTLDPHLRERVRSSELEPYTYLDGLITILVRFLRAEPSERTNLELHALTPHIHATVAEVLQVILSRGESEIGSVPTIEAVITSRLFLSIHRHQLDLQNKLLHVLHSVLHALSTTARRQQHRSTPSNADVRPPLIEDAQPAGVTRDELFVRIVSDAITIQNNNAVIHHWIDFLLMSIPLYRTHLRTVIFPLIDCLIGRVRALVTQFKRAYSSNWDVTMTSDTTDAEFTVIINALERLVLIANGEALNAVSDEELRAQERSGSDGGGTGLLGYVTGVLSSTEAGPTEVTEDRKLRMAAVACLNDAVALLLTAWDALSAIDIGDDRQPNSKHFFLSRVRLRIRKAMERLHKASPTDVFDDVMRFWIRNDASPSARENAFRMLDVVVPLPLSVVSMISDRLAPKGVVPKQITPSDEATFAFFEAFLSRIDPAIAVQVWSACLQLIRDFATNTAASKLFTFPCLRCFTTLSEKVVQTNALEDRRMRRDLQDLYLRLVEGTIVQAGRSADTSGWLRRHRDQNGDNESIVSIDKGKEIEDAEEEKRLPAVPLAPISQAREMTEYLARHVLLNCPRFLIDGDKTASLCSNMTYYIVSPAFKTRAKTFDVDDSIFELLREMTKNPVTTKAWRATVADAFADHRFFHSPPSSHTRWRPLVQSLMATDKERVVELIAKISTVSSANIFTFRDLESVSRALSLRRLTYTLFTSEKDRFLTQLPLIQEKLVDLLRGNVGGRVHAEVYLCLRVLFCRIGHNHLIGLWPLILTELLRLFESLVEQAVPDNSDLLHLIVSACKFLDLVLVLQIEHFQLHEWVFITDTIDAVNPPSYWLPLAIVDQLGMILTNSNVLPRSSDPATFDWAAGRPQPRRPNVDLQNISSIAGLEPFFTSASMMAYESNYHSSGRIDWDLVEHQLVAEIFDSDHA